MQSSTTEIAADTLKALRAFRFRKNQSEMAALILKIDAKNLTVNEDQLMEGITLDDLAEELPENTPRFILISYEYTHPSGRKSNPLVGRKTFLIKGVFYSPENTSDNNRMLYASSKPHVFAAADIGTRILELFRSEDLTQEWLDKEVGLIKS